MPLFMLLFESGTMFCPKFWGNGGNERNKFRGNGGLVYLEFAGKWEMLYFYTGNGIVILWKREYSKERYTTEFFNGSRNQTVKAL